MAVAHPHLHRNSGNGQFRTDKEGLRPQEATSSNKAVRSNSESRLKST